MTAGWGVQNVVGTQMQALHVRTRMRAHVCARARLAHAAATHTPVTSEQGRDALAAHRCRVYLHERVYHLLSDIRSARAPDQFRAVAAPQQRATHLMCVNSRSNSITTAAAIRGAESLP